MKVAVGCDHAGFPLKETVIAALRKLGAEVVDFGTHSLESVDYPDFGERVGRAVASGEVDRGVVICGTGIGVSIAANKVPGVRAALCHDVYSARMSRAHNDANVLAMGARVIGPGLAEAIVEAWLTTSFEGGRHRVRVDKLNRIGNPREE
ncbi:MAG: ribose 5-phosphate isomerase B [Clostridia bacterium]|nr:ribose 5-phosphate isomerase B [Bacillota bacterium]MBO2521895.1 ribose 5-phosphate isomerase B [Bacillota bacterium]